MKKSVSPPMRMTSLMLTLLLLFSMTGNLGIVSASAREIETEKELVYIHEIRPGSFVARGAFLTNDIRFSGARAMDVYIDGTLLGRASDNIQMPCNAVLQKMTSEKLFIQDLTLYFKSIKNPYADEELKEKLGQSETVELSENMLFGDTITINDGKNHVINANGYSLHIESNMAGMFVVENGSTLTINGKGENDQTTIISNAGNKGADTGAIRVLKNSKLIVHDVTFDENKSKNGGAVSVRGGSVQMKDCVVQNCSANEKGGGLFADEAATVTLTNCTFDSNSAYDGGGIANFGRLTVTDCAVKSNTVRGGGAGICSKGDATLSDSTIEQNTNAINGGGVTNHKNMTIKGCTISGNSASSWGGGFFNESDGNTVIKGDTVIEGNTANDGAGIFHRQGKLSVTDTSILKNSAKTFGGGLWANNDTQVTLNNVTVKENNCGTNGGALNSHGTLALSNCTIETNSAGDSGGGIYLDSPSSLTLENTSVLYCTAGNAGGGIYLYAGELILAGGKLRITDNLTNGNSSNIDQRDFKPIQITARLTGGSEIGIKPPSEGATRDVTTGYGKYNDVDPTRYFRCDTNEYRVNYDKKDELNLIEGLRSTNKSYKVKIHIAVTNDADVWYHAYFHIYGKSDRGRGEQKLLNTSPDFHESIDEYGESYTYEYDCGADDFPTGVEVETDFGNWGVWRDFEGDVTISINDVLVSSPHVVHSIYGYEEKKTMLNIGGDKYPYPDLFEIDTPPGDIEESGVITVSGVDQYGLIWKANGDNTSMKNISFPEKDTFKPIDNSGFKWRLSSSHRTNHMSTYHLTFKSGSNVYPEITKAITVRFVFPLHVKVFVNGKEVMDKTAQQRDTVQIRNIESIPGYYINGYEKEGTGELVKVTSADYDLTLVNESVILRAKLLPNNYRIAFDGNGTVGADGTYDGIEGTMNTKTAYYDKPFKLQGNNFMRTGYLFVGWNTQPDGKGKMFKDKDTVLNLTTERKAVVKLYAIWRAEDGATTASIFSDGTALLYIGSVILLLSIAVSIVYYKRKKREGVQTADR